jgi:hypothetical protein
MDRTTIDESDNESEYSDGSNSSEQETRLSSDTLEANIEFVSSEDDLAASSTESGTSGEHEEHAPRDNYTTLIVDEAQEPVLVPGNNDQVTIDTIAKEAQQDMVTTGTAATAPPARWLGTGRTTIEAQGMFVALKKEDRASLTANYLLKLQKKTTEGMELTFLLMMLCSADQLEECYNLGLRVETLQTRLKKTDLIGGLNIWCSATTSITPTDIMLNKYGPALALIEYIDVILEQDIHNTMRFKHYYGQEYNLQDLQWSQELLENS